MQYIIFILPLTITAVVSYPTGFDGLQGLIVAGGEKLSQFGNVIQNNKPVYQVPTFGSIGRERAILESENKLSQLSSAYTYAQNYVASFKNYKPIVDTVQEYEKYGNDGGRGRQISKALIDGFDGIANVVNAVIDAPSEKAQHLSRTATAALNGFGRTLVGL